MLINKNFCKRIILPFLFLSLFASVSSAKYSGGSGTESDPYLIATPEDMNAIGANATDWNKNFKMIADINLAAYYDTKYKIIGVNSPNHFSGVFDGNGHKIYNFNYYANTAGTPFSVGLFGYVENAVIKNLGIERANITIKSSYSGVLAGNIGYSTITNCYCTGKISSTCDYPFVGGLIGNAGLCTISNCYSNMNVTANSTKYPCYAGGLIGSQIRGTTTNCFSKGIVTAKSTVTSSNAGGLIGILQDYCIVTNCYSTASVSASYYGGGLVPNLPAQSTIERCYSTGTVSAGLKGGLLGHSTGTVIGCFWDKQSSGLNSSAGGSGVIGKTTSEMQTLSTFTNAGWDFVDETANGTDDIWSIYQGVSYPIFKWYIDSSHRKYSGGIGTVGEPYLIATLADMNAISTNWNDWDKCFKMIADIDMSTLAPNLYKIIATDYRYPFTGIFDGNGHTISNFTWISPDTSYIGLFGNVDIGGVIKNLHLRNVNIDVGSGTRVGTLTCYLTNSQIINCGISNSSLQGNEYIGGLVAFNYGTVNLCYADKINITGIKIIGGVVATNQKGAITKSWADANVIADDYVGALSGNNYASISECFSRGKVLGRDSTLANVSAGGLVGENAGHVLNCYSHAKVTGDSQVGGLCGVNAGSSGVKTIEKCYSTGVVNGSSNTGGLVGLDFSEPDGQTINSFWDVQRSHQQGSFGGTGLQTLQMKTKTTFTNAGWDFTNIWKICEGANYPKLAWQQKPTGDFVCPDGVGFEDFTVLANQWMLEKLPFDTAPTGEDGIVNFLDFANFANTWQGDYNQLYGFASQWLTKGMYNADISPVPTGDGIVDYKDLQTFAENWLRQN